MSIDISVIVTAHAEGLQLHTTLRNIRAAIEHAQARGISAELILVLDSASAATMNYVADVGKQLLTSLRHTILEVTNGDPGLSRMSGANASAGRYVALVDGDNLFNETWLAEAVEFLRLKPTNYVAHPAFVVTFGERASVRIVASMDSPRFGYGDLLNENPWDTAAVMERSLLLAHPYRAFALDSQLGPEDWVWNIETVLGGVRHVPVPETVMFYRAKGVNSSVNERRQVEGALLPPCDIVALAAMLGPGTRSPLSQRHRGSRRFLSRIYQAIRPARRVLTRRMPGLAHALYLFARRTYVMVTRITLDELATSMFRLTRDNLAFLTRERVALGHFEATLAFLPQIPLLPAWRVDFREYAELLVNAVTDIGTDVTHVVAVPWLGIGGADLIAQNYAQGFAEITGDSRSVVILSERGNWIRNPGLNPEVRVLSLGESALDLPEFLKARLVAEVMVQCQPKRVHIVNAPSAYAAVRNFGRALGGRINFTASAFCVDRTEDDIAAGYLMWQSDNYLPELRAIYCDNRQVALDLHQLVGFPQSLFSVHYQPRHVGPEAELDRRNSGWPTVPTEREKRALPLRVLWAARLDRQKNVDTLISISQEIAQRGLPIEIHVYGSFVLDARSARIKHDLGLGSTFHGNFEGGLAAISRDVDAFLMTSLWEGMPLTLIEATDRRLPIVAPNVGGITEFVENEVSGLIVEDPRDVDAYVEALVRLRDDVALRRKLVVGARARAASQHFWDGFVTALNKSETSLDKPSRQRE